MNGFEHLLFSFEKFGTGFVRFWRLETNQFVLFLFCLFSLATHSQLTDVQQKQIEGFREEIKNANHDSLIINAWKKWDEIIYVSNPELDAELNRKIEKLCVENLKKSISKSERAFFLKSQAIALNIIGLNQKNKGDYYEAIGYHKRSIEIMQEISDERGVANSLNNLGVIYRELGDFSKAISYHNRAMKIHKKLNHLPGVANAFTNIGQIYNVSGKMKKAAEYEAKSLKIKEALNDKIGIANSLNNLGNIYGLLGEHDKALEYCRKSLKIHDEFGNNKEIASTIYNLALILEGQGDVDGALVYHQKGLEIREKLSDKSGIAQSLIRIGKIHQLKGDFNEAIKNNQLALQISSSISAAILIRDASQTLYECFQSLGMPARSLDMFKLFIKTRDSLESNSNQEEMIRQEYKYEFEKKTAIQKAENEKQKIKVKQQEQQAYILYGGLAIALLFGAFILNRFRVTNKQKKVIEEKNVEILDSINYAKRIQSAILPSDKSVQESLKDSFIIYKPKDIVAGDFYWLEQRGNRVLFAAADCTGHGVPGAMVSVVCHNALNRAVREFGLGDPGEILNKSREIVVNEFEKSHEDVKDGMDIALCSLDGKKLEYAGANNPLWIIRNGAIIETKANKQPIGKFDNPEPYSTHKFDLKKGDTIYIFSDGFVDQFGGPFGKKYKASGFRRLLLRIQENTLIDQKRIINESFENWKGDLDQIDDVCIIGVRT